MTNPAASTPLPSSPHAPDDRVPRVSLSVWLLFGLLCGAVVALAHGRAVREAWLLDDLRLVRDSGPVARGLEGMPDLLARSTPAGVIEPESYRPLAMASIAAQAIVRNDVPEDSEGIWVYLLNLVLHALSGLALAILLYRACAGFTASPARPGRTVAFAAAGALVFLAHPLMCDALARAVGRADVLATFFVLVSLLLWQRIRRGASAWIPVLSLVWFVALLCKEVVVLLPLPLLVLDPWIAPAPTKGKPWLLAFAFLPPTALYFLMGGFLPRSLPGIAQAPLADHILVGLEGWLANVFSWWSPSRIPVDTSHALPLAGPPTFTPWGLSMAAAMALAAILCFVVPSETRRRAWLRAALGILLWGAAVAWCTPTGAAFEPRFAMIGLLPMSVLFAGVLWSTARKTHLALGVIPLLAFAGSLVWLSHRQYDAYESEARVLQHTLRDTPLESGVILRLMRHHRLAALDARRAMGELPVVPVPTRDPQRAPLQPFEEGYRHQQVRAELDAHLQNAHELSAHLERVPEARELPDFLRERGLLLLARSRAAEAFRLLKRAAALDPLLRRSKEQIEASVGSQQAQRTAEMLRGIGRCHVALGQGKESVEPYSFAARLDPNSVHGLLEAGTALTKYGALEKGIAALKQAQHVAKTRDEQRAIADRIRSGRQSARIAARVELRAGTRALDRGEHQEALTHFQRALQLDPTYPQAMLETGWLTGHWFGRYDEAHAYLDRAEAALQNDTSPNAASLVDKVRVRRSLLIDQKRGEDAEEEREIERESNKNK